MPSSRLASLRKNWLTAILLILVIGEASALAEIETVTLSRYLAYGSFQYGCTTLEGSPASNAATVNITNVRWIVFQCPNGSALIVHPAPCFFCAKGPLDIGLTPTFTPPPGVLGIFIVDDPMWNCPGQNPTMPFNRSPLVSGVSTFYVQYTDRGPDYCVILNSSVKTIEPFSVQWSTGPPTPAYMMPTVSFSAPSVTVAHGQNATFQLTLKSEHGFHGNVTFKYGGGLFAFLDPPSLMIKTDGSNSTTVTVETTSYTPPGSYYVEPIADPTYGLQFYGDYSGSPLYQGNSTKIPITVT